MSRSCWIVETHLHSTKLFLLGRQTNFQVPFLWIASISSAILVSNPNEKTLCKRHRDKNRRRENRQILEWGTQDIKGHKIGDKISTYSFSFSKCNRQICLTNLEFQRLIMEEAKGDLELFSFASSLSTLIQSSQIGL